MTAVWLATTWCLVCVAYWLGYRRATQRAIRIVKRFGETH